MSLKNTLDNQSREPGDSDSRHAPRRTRPAPVNGAAARAPAIQTAAARSARHRSMAQRRGPDSRRAPRPAPVDSAAARAPCESDSYPVWPSRPRLAGPRRRLVGRESATPANAATLILLIPLIPYLASLKVYDSAPPIPAKGS